jgi:UrcA family protein
MKVRFLALAVLAAAFTTGLGVSPAMAETASVTIGYGDLNLASRAGRAALDQRIDGAARQLCGESSPLELKMVALGRSCRAGVLADARSQLASSSTTSSPASA